MSGEAWYMGRSREEAERDRRLMGEDFLAWAEGFFAHGRHCNVWLEAGELERAYGKPVRCMLVKLHIFCVYKGYEYRCNEEEESRDLVMVVDEALLRGELEGMRSGTVHFLPPTTYEGAMEMVRPLDPDTDDGYTTAEKYMAFERLKTFFRILFSEE